MRGTMHGVPRVCEVIIELYRMLNLLFVSVRACMSSRVYVCVRVFARTYSVEQYTGCIVIPQYYFLVLPNFCSTIR